DRVPARVEPGEHLGARSERVAQRGDRPGRPEFPGHGARDLQRILAQRALLIVIAIDGDLGPGAIREIVREGDEPILRDVTVTVPFHGVSLFRWLDGRGRPTQARTRLRGRKRLAGP